MSASAEHYQGNSSNGRFNEENNQSLYCDTYSDIVSQKRRSKVTERVGEREEEEEEEERVSKTDGS